MKIIRLTAEAFQRLTAVEIEPDGSLVIVAGRNAQGKTSVLDAIEAALSGRAAAKIKRPIRDGETKARVELDLGDLVVERIWTQSGSKLKVTSAAGAEYPSPQKMLDGLIGRLSFDPLEFANADAKEQVKTLLSVVDLPFDPDELEAQRQAAYDQRTIVNRDAKALKAKIDGLPRPPRDLPTTQVDVVGLSNALQEIRHADHGRRRRKEEYDDVMASIARLQANAAALQADGRRLADDFTDLVGKYGTPDEIQIKIELAGETNKALYQSRQRTEMIADLKTAESQSNVLSQTIKSIERDKADAIAAADLPYPGLGFDTDGVTLDGIPFSQSSGAERLKVSLAIALRLNPEIKVVRITDGSLLDADSMKAIEAMIPEDGQVWIERVSDGDEVGVIIEDGFVQIMREGADAIRELTADEPDLTFGELKDRLIQTGLAGEQP